MDISIHKTNTIHLSKIERFDNDGKIFYSREINIYSKDRKIRDTVTLYAETREELELKI